MDHGAQRLQLLLAERLALTFGLGADKVVQTLEVEWPSGARQKFTNVPTNQVVTIEEARGIVPAAAPAAKPAR